METVLEEIGLTEGETKVYLALLRLGSTKTGPLASESKVSSSKVYKILDRLEKKGLAGHVIKGKIKFYEATSPNRIIDYVEEKERKIKQEKKKLKEILPELQSIKKSEKSEATIYEGFKAITNIYRNILDELKEGDKYYVIGAHYGEDKPGWKAFFESYHRERVRKKIKVKMLANSNIRKTIVKTTRKLSSVKFLPQYLVNDMIVVFYKDKTFIFFLTDQPKGFLIESKEVNNSFRSYFDTFWRIAEK